MEAKRWKISLPAQLDIVFHGNEIPRLTKTENDRKSLHRLLVQAGSITCVSSFGKNMLKKIFPELSDKIHIIHPGFRSDLKTDFKIERARREIFRILTVARIVPVKGHLAMIRSLGCLSRPIRRQIEYRLVGPVSFRPFLWFLKSMALWHGVRMIWQGSLDSEGLIREYQEADIFALTSVPFMGRAEAFPLVYLEAGLFCLPLVGHQIGGVGDIIIDGETGFLCKINQPKELSDRILLLMNDEDLRKKMGLSAHERSKQFTWKRFVSELYPEAVDLLSQKQKVARV
jgi:glycosyltransferase involved in cell wall biosynthesis